MKDKHLNRRAFLRRMFGTTAAVVVAGPAVLEALDRIDHEPKTVVDMGRLPHRNPEIDALLRQIRGLHLPPATWENALLGGVTAWYLATREPARLLQGI